METITRTRRVGTFQQGLRDIDAQTDEVRGDGQLLTCEPATVLPMAQRYFLL